MKNKKQTKVEEVVKSYTDKQSIKSDPNGSWTGRPKDKNEIPVQDADDLWKRYYLYSILKTTQKLCRF